MIEIYTIAHCSACHPERDKFYKAVHDYCRAHGRLDLDVIPLTSTEALRHYNKEVKPYRNGRDSLPMVFDDDKKQELIFDEQGKVQPRGLLRAKKQAAQEPPISGRRRRDAKEAQPSDAQELAQTR